MSMREHLYQIVVEDYSKKRNGRRETILFSDGNTKKKVDIVPQVPRRTLFKRTAKYKTALRYAEKFGTVISCQKVDESYYLKNIEFLNLGEPRPIVIDREEIVVGKDFSVKRPRRTFNIEIDKK